MPHRPMAPRGPPHYSWGITLDKQQVLVVGGSSGIGLAVARASLEAGAHVTLASRSEEKLARAAAGLATPDRVRTLALDITDEARTREALERLVPQHHIVLTAVDPYYQPIRQFDLARARRTLDSKLLAALHLARYARFEPAGSLTFVTGVASERPSPGGAAIAAVNGAVNALARALALELAPLRVNALSPGWVDTPLWDATPGLDKSRAFDTHARRLPVGRVGRPEEVARAARFLMENGFTTGEVLHVDGGHRLV
ncbi:SDR family oxidoreductase [Myxococcus sp. K15C18031901]|uniref:SDR family oxidoreductase n=1 Tax=Myxococcus dinghuensis TaxID=2906761 RepID=UPI0020A7DB66|nr:SDR family oxidoreductase [Myxococcus dinghuensis]MCP3098024.1 SDR family oxidoreductase [Myxococcus dinghuensis]